MNLRLPELAAATGEQKVRRARACPRTEPRIASVEQLVSTVGIGCEHATSRGMKWNKSRLQEFATANRQHAGLEVYILAPQGERFVHPHTGDRQQADERMHRPGAKRLTGGHAAGRCHQLNDFPGRIQVGLTALRRKRQELPSRHFRSGLETMEIPGELSHRREPPGPRGRSNVRRCGRPLKSESRRDNLLMAVLHERAEGLEVALRFDEPKSQRSAQSKIVPESVAQRAHDTPPGHRSVRARRRFISTLA